MNSKSKKQYNLFSWCFLLPWLALFMLFTVIPVTAAFVLSFTDFNLVQTPTFVGVENYARMLLDDDVFITSFINTLVFAIITGPLGYILSFVIAWFINDVRGPARSFLIFLFYSPSLAGNSFMIWSYIFSGDSYGLLNSVLMKLSIINEPLQWLTDARYNKVVCILVILWGSMGAGFLSFVAGLKQLNHSLFEAAAIDGIRNRWQEVWHITLPQMLPQLLIGAVLTISGSFSVGAVNATLTGNPSTDYSTHTLVLHISDHGYTRFEMGYASAIAVVLFILIILAWKFTQGLIRAVSRE